MSNNERNETIELIKKEHKAKCWIQNSVDYSIFDNITSTSTTHESWEVLKLVYQGNDTVKTVKLQTLRSQFKTIKMTHTKNVDQFMTTFMGIVNHIKLISETITDRKIVEKVL